MIVETSTTEYVLSTFQPLVVIVPDAPLEPEHEYRITYQSTPVVDAGPIDIRRFRTLAASPEPRAFLPPLRCAGSIWSSSGSCTTAAVTSATSSTSR